MTGSPNRLPTTKQFTQLIPAMSRDQLGPTTTEAARGPHTRRGRRCL
ncbi:hypothetical protein [Corynebacterium parakroppenstedtii]|nr:hypothetical protein [Corynebacterium parakroppenstedtii]KXB50073.1 hypothetical protein HMPREF1861_01545 [Corynebacterium kroppenstedtii]MCF7183657.1 hypothetical protein [Corynebacterium parakroppenstedtii]MCF8701645.1 hypothetical protein [Corynebacterium parakroppenstedtii]